LSYLSFAYLDLYGAELVEDKEVAYQMEGITRRVGRELEKANASQVLIGLLEMISR
jgi:hypothetical protein